MINIEENNQTNTPSYEFNSFHTCGEYNSRYLMCHIESLEDLKCILRNPMEHNKQIRDLSRLTYNTNPIVSNGVDYLVSLPCLDHILICDGKSKSKCDKNKEIVKDILIDIGDKEFIRDALHRDCLDGACYYYFNTDVEIPENKKFIDDYEMETTYELNNVTKYASIFSLPTDYVKIRGYKRNRAVLAFNLAYFDEYEGQSLENKLRKYPKEIREGYQKCKNGETSGKWLVLDSDKTIVHKIKSTKREPYGRPITISALIDILYNDHLTSTKRNVLDEINNKVIYETFPEGEKGKCSLTQAQQENQHNTVKNAILTKNNRGGTSFFSVAAGTKIDTIDTSVDILNEEIEPKLNSRIAMGIGVALGLLDGESGNYSSQQINLELMFSKVYTWVTEIANELNYVINKNVIKDKNNEVNIYYLPTTLVNKDKFISQCKDLYMAGSGSKSAWISAVGYDVDAYVSLMDKEKAEKWDEKYKPHLTSYTSSDSADKPNPDGNLGGRPEMDNVDVKNENTLQSKTNNSNNTPKPSTS